jgi:2-deoxy-D-gluconate 3-dehydrogenase
MSVGRSLDGQVAIVTGAGRGIGRSIALGLAEAGAAVLINDREPANLIETESALAENKANFGSAPGDIADADFARALPAVAVERLGRLDILVNNAAIFRHASFLALELDAIDDVMNVNYRGPFLLCQAAARYWVEQQQPGVVVNITSVSASFSQPGVSHYGATKAALERLSRCMALELAPHGIRVNCIAPGGPILSDYVQEVMGQPGSEAYAKLRPPLGRLGEPSEIADAVVYLASGAASYITGAVLTVDGGLTLGRRW